VQVSQKCHFVVPNVSDLELHGVTVFDDGDTYNKCENQKYFKNVIHEFIDYHYRNNFSPP
jgi:hypothetical protein